ncbi:MAG: hypothetical protein M1813_008324 [Trichoglossum hirsutum]|nr:MAG: hypothetical protein M1813_008324 [Trichoglossum hirsutum]
MQLQFPDSRPGWRLDVVSLLAVVGESSMSEHAQPLTATRLCLIPRLIPAPQALLKPSRPSGLPSKNAIIVGVHSGAMVTELNYFANLLHPISELVPLTVRVISISHKRPSRGRPSEIFPSTISPLNLLTIGSTLLSIGLLVWSIMIHDGVAFVAILTISTASSVVGLASLWEPKLTKRALASRVPPGDVVVRTRKGAFLVVHCSEEVTRELYIGTEECSYFIKSQAFQALVGIGTLLLMIAVVLMGNCTWTMQLAIGVSYILLNGLYWCAALLPARWHWDLGRYHLEKGEPKKLATYTEALWEAIRAAGKDENGNKRGERYSADWVQTSNAAPKTPAWINWRREAEDNVNIGNEKWNAVEAWQRLQTEEDVENGVEEDPIRLKKRMTENTVSDIPLDDRV